MVEGRVQVLFDDPLKAATQSWIADPNVFDLFLARCLPIVDSTPAEAIEPVTTAMKHAPLRCQRVVSLGLWAQINRALGKDETAENAIEQAFVIGNDCTGCMAEVYRHRATVRRNHRNFDAAIVDATTAIRIYLETDLDHSLHGNGLASAYNARAIIRYYMGDHEGAAADEHEALAVLDPKRSPALYRIVITNLASALQATGRHSDLLEAEEYLKKARRLFSGVSKRSQERAKLDWLTAQVRYKLGKGRPCELRVMMKRARADFLALGFTLEAVAVASDLMKMKLAKTRWGHGGARDMCRDVMADLLELRNISAEVTASLHQVAASVEECGWHAKDQLKASVDQLREACGPNMMACLLTWETP